MLPVLVPIARRDPEWAEILAEIFSERYSATPFPGSGDLQEKSSWTYPDISISTRVFQTSDHQDVNLTTFTPKEEQPFLIL